MVHLVRAGPPHTTEDDEHRCGTTGQSVKSKTAECVSLDKTSVLNLIHQGSGTPGGGRGQNDCKNKE